MPSPALHQPSAATSACDDAESTRETLRLDRLLLSDIRLWDWRAPDVVYPQFQEFRPDYDFVDLDRYRPADDYRQVMVLARELSQDTHGHGARLATVRGVAPDARPTLLVRDILPRTTHPELGVKSGKLLRRVDSEHGSGAHRARAVAPDRPRHRTAPRTPAASVA